MQDRYDHYDDMVRSILADEREAIAVEARRYAAFYPQSSDGRNTFIMFAEFVERRSLSPSIESEIERLSGGERL